MTIASLHKLVKHFCTVFGLTLFNRGLSKSTINLVTFILLWTPFVTIVLKFIRLEFTEDILTRQSRNVYFEEKQLRRSLIEN